MRVDRASSGSGANQVSQYERVGTAYVNHPAFPGPWPVFVIRPTHLRDANGYTHCLDMPYSTLGEARPLWIHPCNGGNAQRFIQTIANFGSYSRSYFPVLGATSRWQVLYNADPRFPFVVLSNQNRAGEYSFYEHHIGP